MEAERSDAGGGGGGGGGEAEVVDEFACAGMLRGSLTSLHGTVERIFGVAFDIGEREASPASDGQIWLKLQGRENGVRAAKVSLESGWGGGVGCRVNGSIAEPNCPAAVCEGSGQPGGAAGGVLSRRPSLRLLRRQRPLHGLLDKEHLCTDRGECFWDLSSLMRSPAPSDSTPFPGTLDVATTVLSINPQPLLFFAVHSKKQAGNCLNCASSAELSCLF